MGSKTYDAFISYRHARHDKAIAEKLQKLLESYIPPKSNNYANMGRIRKIFRDESELPTSGDLGNDIKKALEGSAFLIVVCSEETAKSQWCLQEISYFKELHNGTNKNILTLLVGGDPREVFPKELCYESRVVKLPDGSEEIKSVEVEPLAANIAAQSTKASLKKLKTEFLRIAAPILGCGYDDLYRRHQKRLVRNVVTGAAVIIAILSSFAAFSYSQFLKINSQASQISSQKSEIESAYGELEKTNQQLTDTNGILGETNNKLTDTNNKLEDTNKKLSDQIDETNRQKNIAEENRIEAENQASLAKENEHKALDNLDLANEQKALAINNKNQAVSNLNMAQEQQLFRTVAYAKQLGETGDRAQAAAILNEAYDRFDKGSKQFPAFKDQIEVAMANTAYYPKYSAYLKLNANEEVTAAAFSEDDSMVAAAAGSSVTVWDSNTGKVIGIYPHKSTVTAIAMKDGYLITGSDGGILSIWALNGGKLILEKKIPVFSENDHDSFGQILCNDAANCIVMTEGSWSGTIDQVVFISYPWQSANSSPEFQVIRLPGGIISCNGRYMLARNAEGLIVFDIDRFDPSENAVANLEKMALADIPVDNLSYNYYLINNQGIVYYKTVTKSESGNSLENKYYANILDAKTNKIIRQFEVSSLNEVFLGNETSDNILVLGYKKVSILDLREIDPFSKEIAINLNYTPEYCRIGYINKDQFYVSNTLIKDVTSIYSMTGEKKAQLASLGNVTSITAISHDAGTAMSVSKDGEILLSSLNNDFGYSSALNTASILVDFITHNKYMYVSPYQGELPELYSFGSNMPVRFSDIEGGYTSFECIAISPDGRQVFGREKKSWDDVKLAIWDAESGKIVKTLTPLNELKPEDTIDVFAMSSDFKFILALIDQTAYVYSLDKNTILYSLPLGEYVDFAGIEEDGKTVWLLNDNGRLRVLDLMNDTLLSDKMINMSGTYIINAAVDLKREHLLIYSTDLFNNGSQRDACLYSLSTGERMIPLANLSSYSYDWLFANDARLAYNEALDSLVTIPSFDMLLKDIRGMSEGRLLTSEERQLCGLSIFDY